jgi:uncharacterized membrane protein YbhN (UPF0104 family)
MGSARLRALLSAAVAVVVLVLAARWFAGQWEMAMAGIDRPPIAWGWVAVAALVLVVHALLACRIWQQVLAAVGAPLAWRQAFDAFAPSLLARYVPGKIWAHSVRVALGRRAGVRYGLSTGAIVWEAAVGLGSAAVVAAIGLAGRAPEGMVRGAVALFVACLAAWAVLALLARTARGAALLDRFGGTAPAREPRLLVPAFSTSLASWLVYGAAHLALVRALVPPGAPIEAALGASAITTMSGATDPTASTVFGATGFALLLGALALAWAGGYLVIVMPAGLGVRDGLLLLLLAPILDPARALLFVGLSRLVQFTVDAGITLGWLARGGLRTSRMEAGAADAPGAADASGAPPSA